MLNDGHDAEHPGKAGIQSEEERFSFPHLDCRQHVKQFHRPSRETI